MKQDSGNVDEKTRYLLKRRYYYTSSVDALYLDEEEYDYAYTIPVTSEILLSFNKENECIGVELLNCWECFGLDKSLLQQATKVQFDIQLTSKVFKLQLFFQRKSNNLLCYTNQKNTYKISSVLPLELQNHPWKKTITWNINE